MMWEKKDRIDLYKVNLMCQRQQADIISFDPHHNHVREM